MRHRKAVNDYNRAVWKKYNKVNELPKINVDKQNNFVLYEGKEADLWYLEIKGMNHQEALQGPQLAWDYFYSGFRRVDGKIQRVTPRKKWNQENGDLAFASGKSYFLYQNQVVACDKVLYGGFSDEDSHFKMPSAVKNLPYQEIEILKPTVYATVDTIEKAFGGRILCCNEQSIVLRIGMKEYEFFANSVLMGTEYGYDTLKKGVLLMEGKYYFPIRDIAILTGKYCKELDGVVYVSDHYFELTHGVARIIKEVLA